MNHSLILTIPEATDCRIMNIYDSSIYNSSQPLSNQILEITPPGKDCPIIVPIVSSGNTVLNVGNLQIFPSYSKGDVPLLPDGIYHIKYSVDPNIRTTVEYDILRTCKLEFKLKQYIKRLFLNECLECNENKDEVKANTKRLNEINDLITAAKYSVEDDKFKASEMYNDAKDLLDKYNNCITCGK